MLSMPAARNGEIEKATEWLLHPLSEFNSVDMPVGRVRVPTPYFPRDRCIVALCCHDDSSRVSEGHESGRHARVSGGRVEGACRGYAVHQATESYLILAKYPSARRSAQYIDGYRRVCGSGSGLARVRPHEPLPGPGRVWTRTRGGFTRPVACPRRDSTSRGAEGAKLVRPSLLNEKEPQSTCAR